MNNKKQQILYIINNFALRYVQKYHNEYYSLYLFHVIYQWLAHNIRVINANSFTLYTECMERAKCEVRLQFEYVTVFFVFFLFVNIDYTFTQQYILLQK